MWIRAFRISNFKSIEDTGTHQLGRHMTLLIGQNNVGKSTVLQALAQQISCRPHRNSDHRREEVPRPNSQVDLDYVMTGQELRDGLMARGGQFLVPLPTQWLADPVQFFRQPEITLYGRWQVDASNNVTHQKTRTPSHNLGKSPDQSGAVFAPNNERTEFNVVGKGRLNMNEDILAAIAAPTLTQHTYLFTAIRSPAPRSPAGSREALLPDASNLPEALSTFQPNRWAYDKYIDQVRRVLPSVKWVSVVPIGNQSEIRVWNADISTGRDDLANPLSECGTGVGQVLAILYVLMRSASSIIVIDEPNSFLHPGAAKVLMSIIREHSEHQFIIATHSPEIIAASGAEHLFVLQLVDEKTTVRELDQNDIASARQVLDEIGSRLSDVFGADAVIWVEGQTEVETFPLLLRAAGKRLDTGITIAPLRSTGDLEGKHAEACADIYRNLSSAGALLPKSLAISLDGDKQGNARIASLSKVFGDVVQFLPRRTFENYLIDPRAIAALAESLLALKDKGATGDKIRQWISDHGRESQYGASEAEPLLPRMDEKSRFACAI
jgi:predicted ATPase